MTLLTKEILERFRTVWDQEQNKDPIIICKFFHPASQRTRYATEFKEDDQLFFWFVVWFENERGYFSLEELQSVKDRFGLGIERDRHFTECTFSQLEEKEGL